MPDPFAPGFLTRLPVAPRKVAVVRASRIGDYICATPALRSLRVALPDAEIALIGLPFVRDLVMRSRHLDRFVEFPGFPGMAEQFFDARRALEFFQAMQAEEFDLAVQLNGSGVYANPFTLMLGARYTVGFIADGDWPSRLDAACPLPDAGPEVERWLVLTTFLGAPSEGAEMEFPIWRTDLAVAAELLADAARPLIGLQPGSREENKCWPAGRFAEAGRALRDRLGGTIVLLGGPDEEGIAAEIDSELSGRVLNLAGRTSVPQLGAVVGQLTILLTNDSGPAHIAYALGTPTVTIFGGTDPARWGPPLLPRHQVVTAPGTEPGEPVGGEAPIARVAVPDVVQAALRALQGADAAENSGTLH